MNVGVLGGERNLGKSKKKKNKKEDLAAHFRQQQLWHRPPDLYIVRKLRLSAFRRYKNIRGSLLDIS
jgi:hypothetical protein